jgi:isopenicillin-N N-acyltransferase like protein
MPLPVIEVSGAPYDMGVQHGRARREKVVELCEDRLARAMADAGGTVTREQALALAEEHLPIHREYAPAVYEEFMGMAKGAEVSPALLLAGNGYTDFKDVLGSRASADSQECSAFIVAPDASADRRLLTGQTWDMHSSAEAHVMILRRRPKAGPASITLTTSGCLSLLGMNEAGIVVQNTNLVPTDARPGVIYLAMIHHALAQETFDAAVAAIVDAPRASGHNYLVGGPDGQAVDIETTAAEHEKLEPTDGVLVHTNHYLTDRLEARQHPDHPMPSSLARQARLKELLSDQKGRLDVQRLQAALADREGGDELGICRHGVADDVKSCAAIIFSPSACRAWACTGPPDAGEWEELTIKG